MLPYAAQLRDTTDDGHLQMTVIRMKTASHFKAIRSAPLLYPVPGKTRSPAPTFFQGSPCIGCHIGSDKLWAVHTSASAVPSTAEPTSAGSFIADTHGYGGIKAIPTIWRPKPFTHSRSEAGSARQQSKHATDSRSEAGPARRQSKPAARTWLETGSTRRRSKRANHPRSENRLDQAASKTRRPHRLSRSTRRLSEAWNHPRSETGSARRQARPAARIWSEADSARRQSSIQSRSRCSGHCERNQSD